MDIFLVRHGEAAASWGDSPDPGLSELGLRQARETALRLQTCLSNDTVILSSPLLRTRQTAEPLATCLGWSVQEAGMFREVPAPVPLSQRQLWLHQFMQQEWVTQNDELQAWRGAAISHLLTLNQPAVIFTHFLLINALVGYILEDTRTVCFRPANGSVTHLRRTDSNLELIELGREMDSVVN